MVVLTTFSQPTEGIRHRQPNTTAFVNDNNLGKGTLYIAESCLSWIRDSGDGFSIEYSNISLHAVSRDLAAFSHECLFLMLDVALEDEEAKSGNGEDGDNNVGSDDEQASTELKFVPDDRGMLDAMFHAMNYCQALHPDPEDSDSDEDLYEVSDDDIQMEETDCRMANLNLSTETFSLYNKNIGSELWTEDMEEGRVKDMEEGSVKDMEEGRVKDMEKGRVKDMGEKMNEDTGEGRVSGSRVLVDRLVEDMGDGRLPGSRIFGGRVLEDRLVEGSGQHYRVQGDRPFFLDSIEHYETSAVDNLAHSPQTPSNFSDAES